MEDTYLLLFVRDLVFLSKPDLSKFLSMAGSLKNELDRNEFDEFIEEAKDAWK